MPRKKVPTLRSRSLPANVADLEAQRVVKRKFTVLDEVEQAYLELYNDPKFRALREALVPEETVEGSISMDDAAAALMIRNKAAEMGLHQAAVAQLNTISLALRAAERRVNASRLQRKRAADE